MSSSPLPPGETRRVLVTGGSGFLGRRIVRTLSRRGHEVLAPRSEACDLRNPVATRAWFSARRPEVVIHSAAVYGGIAINVAEPARLFHDNLAMVLSVFDAAHRAGARKVISVGSACAYPGDRSGDLAEPDFWQGALHPTVEPYGFSKRAQLVALRAWHRQHGLEGNHLVLTNLYGEHDVFHPYRAHVASGLVKRFVDAARTGAAEVVNWGDGTPRREFLYVGDAAEIVARTVALPHDPEPLNVGTGIATSIRELSALIARISGFQGEIRWDVSRPNGVPRKVLDVSRMQSLFPDFQPLSLEEGLTRTIRWYEKHREEADRRQ